MNNQNNIIKENIAKNLLKIKAIFLRPSQPFTWASGIKSPIYCDNRLILSDIETRKMVEIELADTIKNNYPNCEMIIGTATAGIPHAAIISTILDLPMGYVRSGAKDHGRQKQIEGKCNVGTKVVVVEDLISTGGSVVQVVEILKNAGVEVLGVVSIFTYNMKKSKEVFKEKNIKNISLLDYDFLISIAKREKFISPEEIIKLNKFRDNPNDESWIK